MDANLYAQTKVKSPNLSLVRSTGRSMELNEVFTNVHFEASQIGKHQHLRGLRIFDPRHAEEHYLPTQFSKGRQTEPMPVSDLRQDREELDECG